MRIHEQNLRTNAACTICAAVMSGRGMGRHLETHLKERRNGVAAFHLKVDGGGDIFWMHIIVPAQATLRMLDQLLRDMWLECCGHLSAFTIGGKRYNAHSHEGEPFDDVGEEDMNASLSEVVQSGLHFTHEYDFGTTTGLRLRAISAGSYGKDTKHVEILARNVPPDFRCEQCGKPATDVCSYCMYDPRSHAWLCKPCASKHAEGRCGEDGFLPVVNSPRVGQCGYEG